MNGEKGIKKTIEMYTVSLPFSYILTPGFLKVKILHIQYLCIGFVYILDIDWNKESLKKRLKNKHYAYHFKIPFLKKLHYHGYHQCISSVNYIKL